MDTESFRSWDELETEAYPKLAAKVIHDLLDEIERLQNQELVNGMNVHDWAARAASGRFK